MHSREYVVGIWLKEVREVRREKMSVQVAEEGAPAVVD
jgi:hypothetical protein